MSVDYRPLISGLRGKDNQPWKGSTVELSIFDSPDLLAIQPGNRKKLLSASTLSNENVGIMQRWIDDCIHNHPECRGASTSWVPTRLLEISYNDGDMSIRLVDTYHPLFPRESPFAALSHVWGNMNTNPRGPLRTVLSNYEHMRDAIPIESLPQNFVDMARTCVSLGIRYMWIDSLCIIQDSIQDWTYEAAQMHLVYQNAKVTIVATSATSSHDGFLHRNIDTIPALKIAYSVDHVDTAGADERASQYMVVCRYDDPLEKYYIFAVGRSKWNTRGWTMQERSLSTRCIHFCRNRMFFECRKGVWTEENDPLQEHDTVTSVLWPRGATTSFAELYEHWKLFLAEYCNRALTVPTDKLPAVQSVAAEITRVTGFEYLPYAGMWLHNLRNELLWFISPVADKSRPPQWRAPSWSWASVDGSLLFWQYSIRNAESSSPESLLHTLSKTPFEVLATDESFPDPRSETRGFLKVQTLVKKISRIQRLAEIPRQRSFFPYDLFTVSETSDGDVGETVFAYGQLDFEEDEKGIPKEAGSLLYLHVNGESRATGLILQRVCGSCDSGSGGDLGGGVSGAIAADSMWRRLGIGTVFQDRAQPAINEGTFSSGDMTQSIMMV
ncbi:HET-domain-containing protein [Rostrohypoxylon terebratum]|nr:HET-domain-containing protein [Rostrohypoxylon terebratum]